MASLFWFGLVLGELETLTNLSTMLLSNSLCLLPLFRSLGKAPACSSSPDPNQLRCNEEVHGQEWIRVKVTYWHQVSSHGLFLFQGSILWVPLQLSNSRQTWNEPQPLLARGVGPAEKDLGEAT